MSGSIKAGQPKLAWKCKLKQNDHVKNYYKNDPISVRLRKEGITQEILKMMFEYAPSTGYLHYRQNRGIKKAGDIAGGKNGGRGGGYWTIHISGFGSIKAHRIIWCFVEGYFPEQEIDHINGNPLDNRWCNLRLVSKVCNLRNSRVYTTNSSGVKGVTWSNLENQWCSRIQSNGKSYFLGWFSDFTEAVCHRYAAEQMLDWLDCDTSSSAYLYLKEQGIVK